MARSIVTVDDLSLEDMEHIFCVADEFLASMHDPARPHRIQGRLDLARSFILATLFFEPSTRTRFSFESAMLRLGGQVISSPSSGGTSASKGESIADTVRVIENYADLIVIRHPSEGAARVAAQYSSVPVINAGDGSHEHPTQTLCDLYTLKREKKTLKDLNVVLYGDLKHGRTVHSLVYALARLGARIIPRAAKGLELPDHVVGRLKRDYGCSPIVPEKGAAGAPIDVLYVTPDQPHQPTLFPDITKKDWELIMKKGIDVFYVTRLQTERLGDPRDAETYPRIDTEFLKENRYKDSRVMHPLPRVSELGYDLDSDPRGIYFKQAAYGVPVRMALMAWLMGLKPASKKAERPRLLEQYVSGQGISCKNPACVMAMESERRHLTPAFAIVDRGGPVVVRCAFCEYERTAACVGRISERKYYSTPARWQRIPAKDMILFAEEADARVAGYVPAETAEGEATPAESKTP